MPLRNFPPLPSVAAGSAELQFSRQPSPFLAELSPGEAAGLRFAGLAWFPA